MVLLYHFLLVLIRTKKSRNAVADIGLLIIKNLYFMSVRNWTSGGHLGLSARELSLFKSIIALLDVFWQLEFEALGSRVIYIQNATNTTLPIKITKKAS